MNLLVFFCENPKRVIPHKEIIQEVWGRTALSPNSLSVAIAALRQALADDVRHPEYIETLKKKGYRLLVVPKKMDPATRFQGRRRRQSIVGAVAALAVLMVVFASTRPGVDLESQHVVIAVAGIENSTRSPENDELSSAVGDFLIAELSRYDKITVRKSVPDAIVPASELRDIHLAESVLSGRLVDQAGGLVLTVHILDQESKNIIWAHSATVERAQILANVVSVVAELGRAFELEPANLTFDNETQRKVEQLYGRARVLASVVNNTTIKSAYSLLLQAVALDPTYGPAHSLLAEMYSWHYPSSFWGLSGNRYELAESELELARQYGGDDAYILVTEAGIALSRDRDYEYARDLLLRAAAARPDDPWVLRPQIWANMLLGDFSLALEYNEKAATVSLDPRSVYAERVVPLYYLGRFQEAADLHVATVDLGLKPTIQGVLAVIMSGDQSEGFRYWVHFIRSNGVQIEDETEPLHWVEAGEIGKAYDWLRERSGEFLNDWNYASVSGSWHVAAGDLEPAVEEITAAVTEYRAEHEPYGEASYSWTLFLYDPLFAPLRRDPRMARSLALLHGTSVP